MGFYDEKIILFLGTPRPHKGIEDLIKAAKMVRIDKLRVLLVGANSHDPYVRTLIQQADNLLRVEDMTSLSDRPRWLAIADLVVLPQHNLPATMGQVPAKLFDAMAMAKPIIATAVSDIPSILEGCGFVIPPHNVRVLTQQIEYVLKNPTDATNRGILGRQRCIMHYSYKAMEKSLQMVFVDYEI
jgi:glycosyltransferase involved in cell wall biosynthesis